MLSGMIKPDFGEVFLNNESINNLPSHIRAEKGLIYLPQQHSIHIKASTFNNLYMILELQMNKKEAKKKTEDLLEEFGLLHIKDSDSHSLSGGEKRRLEIARALIMKPKFLFLDEPFTGIDPITILEIQKILMKLKEKNIGIIITDHNVKDTFRITDKVYILQKGNILMSGPPEEVIADKKTRDLFLGYEFTWEK
jgi:lipopolysaccharide export system ATP-binding protein